MQQPGATNFLTPKSERYVTILEMMVAVSKLRAYTLSNKLKQLTNTDLLYESSEMILVRVCWRLGDIFRVMGLGFRFSLLVVIARRCPRT